MTIKRADLHKTDLRSVATGKTLREPTPGDILREEFMAPLNLSANALAVALRVDTPRVNMILHGKRGITADTAWRLARYFGTTPEFWMTLQTNYELRAIERQALAKIDREILPREVEAA